MQRIHSFGNMYILHERILSIMKIKLREVLNKKGKSIYWLNKETGIASSTLSRICNSKTSSIEFSVLDKICNALNCEVSDILEHSKSDIIL